LSTTLGDEEGDEDKDKFRLYCVFLQSMLWFYINTKTLNFNEQLIRQDVNLSCDSANEYDAYVSSDERYSGIFFFFNYNDESHDDISHIVNVTETIIRLQGIVTADEEGKIALSPWKCLSAA
jgi:hypothetical protein